MKKLHQDELREVVRGVADAELTEFMHIDPVEFELARGSRRSGRGSCRGSRRSGRSSHCSCYSSRCSKRRSGCSCCTKCRPRTQHRSHTGRIWWGSENRARDPRSGFAHEGEVNRLKRRRRRNRRQNEQKRRCDRCNNHRNQ